jgi:hypothetical protein
MKKGQNLEFKCIGCKRAVVFSLQNFEVDSEPICCGNCDKVYRFEDQALRRQLTKFSALCQQIAESEEILDHTSVAIDIGSHHVKVPYKLLLSRLNSQLDLNIGGEKLSVTFRVEPLHDLEELTMIARAIP